MDIYQLYATAGPAPSRSGHHKNKVVHIHGTNGAKFNGTNFFGTREPTCTYEEWHNPTSVYNTTLKRDAAEKKEHRHRRSKSASADRPKPADFHAVHLGASGRDSGGGPGGGPGDHLTGNPTAEMVAAAAAHAAAQAAAVAAANQREHQQRRTESSSRSSKERKRNSRSNSKSSSQSSPSYGCTVKGTSAIILTPDSIVYNDEGIWSHRYDTSPRPH